MMPTAQIVFLPALVEVAPAAAETRPDASVAELDRLDAAAKAAFDREMARAQAAGKNDECPQAGSALRSILALDAPGDSATTHGPSGAAHQGAAGPSRRWKAACAS